MLRLAVVGLLLLLLLPASAAPPVEALLQQAYEVRSANPERFARLLDELGRVESSASPEQVKRLTYLRAYADSYAGRCEEGRRKSEQLIRTATDADLKARASALIVNCYAASRQFLEGLKELERLSFLTTQTDRNETRQHSLYASANLYNQVGQYRLGLRDVTTLLENSGPVPPRNRCFSEQLRLDLLEHLGELPADEVALRQLVDLCLSLDEPLIANFARVVLARQRVAVGRSDEAKGLLRTHLAEIEKTRYPLLISEAKALLAERLLADGDLRGAEKYASEAIAGGDFDRAILPLVAAHKVLYEVSRQRGDLAAALQHYRKFAKADKAYLDEVKTRELAYQVVRQETALKTQKNAQQIELLNQQNQVLQLRQKVSEQSAQNSRLLIALLAVLLLSIGYWAWRIKRGHRALSKLAQTDALTGVCNRQHFTRLAQEALTRRARRGDAAALVMFDLDHFKNVNDRHGHITGDWTLKQVVDSCRECCGPKDYIGRLGGEEFAILTRGRDLKAATQLAEACRTRIARIDTAESGYVFSVTASFGVTSTVLSGYDLTTLLANADDALYRAKHEGRNRVCTYSGGMTQASPEVPAPTMRLRDATVD